MPGMKYFIGEITAAAGSIGVEKLAVDSKMILVLTTIIPRMKYFNEPLVSADLTRMSYCKMQKYDCIETDC